jgi:hypothetical protein
MLALLLATGTLEKLAWVVGVLLVLVVTGAGVSRIGSAFDRGHRGGALRDDIDRGFRKPPDEGGLL